jgi:hypothetical protein
LHLFAQLFPDRVPNPHLGPKILAAICPKMDKAVTFLLKVALKCSRELANRAASARASSKGNPASALRRLRFSISAKSLSVLGMSASYHISGLTGTRPISPCFSGIIRSTAEEKSDMDNRRFIWRQWAFHVVFEKQAQRLDEFLGRLGRLGDDGVAVVIEPIDQGTDRGLLLIFNDRDVIERA